MVIIRIQLLCTFKFGDRKSKISYSSHSLCSLFPEAQFQEFDSRLFFYLFIHSSSSDNKKRRRRFTSWRWSQVCYRNRKHVARRRQESGGGGERNSEVGRTPPPMFPPFDAQRRSLSLCILECVFNRLVGSTGSVDGYIEEKRMGGGQPLQIPGTVNTRTCDPPSIKRKKR